MPVEPRTLAQMQLRPTAYEIIARCGERQERLGFSERVTRGSLIALARINRGLVLDMLGDWDGEATYSIKTGWVFGPVRICKSGYTERDLASA